MMMIFMTLCSYYYLKLLHYYYYEYSCKLETRHTHTHKECPGRIKVTKYKQHYPPIDPNMEQSYPSVLPITVAAGDRQEISPYQFSVMHPVAKVLMIGIKLGPII